MSQWVLGLSFAQSNFYEYQESQIQLENIYMERKIKYQNDNEFETNRFNKILAGKPFFLLDIAS